jgi:hypothetical protein
LTASAEATAHTEADLETTGDQIDSVTGPRDRSGGRLRWWGIGLTIAALVVGVLVMLWPAVAAPLHADQRYMYLNVPGRVQGDWLDIVRILWSEIPERAEQGRVTPVGYFMTWLFYNGTTELSVATGTPIVVLHGVQKVFLFAAGVLCVAAFVASLRGRRADGELVAPSRSTVWLVVAGTVVLGAVGTQTQLQFRNGWLSYPVLTYTAVIVSFGVPALTLWLTRRMAERSTVTRTAVTVTAMVLIGLFLNVSYELYYVAFPAAILALLLQPDPRGEGRRRAKVAKLVTGGTLSVAFLAAFGAIRVWTANACVDQCYVGAQVQISAETARIAWYNLISSLPLTGRGEALAGLKEVGTESLPGPFSSPLTIGCILAGLALVAARILVRPGSAHGDTDGDGGDVEGGGRRRAESAALVRGAVVALAIGVGSAVVMSLSAQAPEIVLGIGHPYRHVVVTWVALCVAGLLSLRALDLSLANSAGIGLWTVTAGVAVLVAGAMLPINLQSTRAENLVPAIRAAAVVNEEVTLGDLAPEADERRCASIRALDEARIPPVSQRFITNSAQLAFRYFYGVDYCSEIESPSP